MNIAILRAAPGAGVESAQNMASRPHQKVSLHPRPRPPAAVRLINRLNPFLSPLHSAYGLAVCLGLTGRRGDRRSGSRQRQGRSLGWSYPSRDHTAAARGNPETQRATDYVSLSDKKGGREGKRGGEHNTASGRPRTRRHSLSLLPSFLPSLWVYPSECGSEGGRREGDRRPFFVHLLVRTQLEGAGREGAGREGGSS